MCQKLFLYQFRLADAQQRGLAEGGGKSLTFLACEGVDVEALGKTLSIDALRRIEEVKCVLPVIQLIAEYNIVGSSCGVSHIV